MATQWGSDMERRRAVTLVVPFYKNEQLVPELFDSLMRCATDLARIDCTVLAINDSPGYDPLRRELSEASCQARGHIRLTVLNNEENVGFVKSANRGLEHALRKNTDAVLLNSDTIVFPGALEEIKNVAYLDPMTGFVSPRSNNATLCSFPVQEEFRTADPGSAFSVFEELSRHLPRFHYVPTVVGFCMYIKHVILDEFGLLDEVYGKGYNEENDLVMRANRTGFRAALANHAFVYHASETSFSTSKSDLEAKNSALLARRYPVYLEKVREYEDAPRYAAETLVTGLLKTSSGCSTVAFDFTTVGAYHNGTFEAAREILSRAARSWSDFEIHVVVSGEAARFHRLDNIPNIYLHPVDTTRVFAAALRIGQPFQWHVIDRMTRLAPVNIYGMLDPIAWDCLHLNQGRELDAMWRFVFQHADGVFYISEFVAQLFRSRFRISPSLREEVCYLSLDPADYGKPASPDVRPSHILVVGNHFDHKRVPQTVEALSRAFPQQTIAAVGMDGLQQHNVVCYPSGDLPEEVMHNLYAGASAIVFPSLYEGFGIPLLKALAYRKPLLARDIPVTAELHTRLGSPQNLIRYRSTADLISLLQDQPPAWIEDGASPSGYNWENVAEHLHGLLTETLRHVSVENVTLPRLTAVDDLNRARAEAAARVREQFGTALADRNTRIRDLEQSLSWKITAPLRALSDPLFRLLRK